MTTIQCEICLHKLATVETLSLPLTGAMFAPPDPWMPPPFAPELDWEWMRCPMCGKRPFILEGRFLLYDQGRYLDVAEGLHRDPETGMLTGCDYVNIGYALTGNDDQGYTAERIETVGTTGAFPPAHEGKLATPEDVAARIPDPIPPSTKPTTVLEEVYRLADTGMKPGQISAELAKAGVTLHHVTIAQKLRGRGTT